MSHEANYPYTLARKEAHGDIQVVLTVVEWKCETDRLLYFCDAEGLTLKQVSPGKLHAPGFHFSAYLKSAYFRELEEAGTLDLEELNPDLGNVVDVAKTKLRALCSWVLSEMVSNSQNGMDLDEAKSAVHGLMKRKYPFMENIHGRVYVDIANSAREAALLILYGIFPKRMSEESLAKQVARHGYSKANAEMAVTRIRNKVDNDDHGNLRLRNVRVREAEELIAKAEFQLSKCFEIQIVEQIPVPLPEIKAGAELSAPASAADVKPAASVSGRNRSDQVYLTGLAAQVSATSRTDVTCRVLPGSCWPELVSLLAVFLTSPVTSISC